MQTVILYSDGQYNQKRNRGGWATCLKASDGYTKAWEGVVEDSNAPRLKLIAIAEGIERLKTTHCHVQIFTNVTFIKQVFDGLKNGNKHLNNQKHVDLWKRIIENRHDLEFVLYKGHGDTPEQKEMYGAANFNAFCSEKAGVKDFGYQKSM